MLIFMHCSLFICHVKFHIGHFTSSFFNHFSNFLVQTWFQSCAPESLLLKCYFSKFSGSNAVWLCTPGISEASLEFFPVSSI